MAIDETRVAGPGAPVQFVLLGGGSVAAELYLPALAQLDALGRVTVFDPNPASIDQLSAAWPQVSVRLGGAEEALAASPAADAMIVAAPNALHVPASRLALGRGLDVLCEKPLALNAADCAALEADAVRARRLLKVAMSRRYLPTWRLAREIVRAGELGAVREIEVVDCAPFRWRPRSFAFFAPEAGGVLADMGVHYLDYLETLVGPLQPLDYADDARGGVESNLRFGLASERGAPVTMTLSRTRTGGTFIRIGCEHGEIRIDKANEREIAVTAAGGAPRRVSSVRPFRNGDRWPESFVGSFCDMIVDFENALAGRPSDIADVADAKRTAALIEWAYARPGRASRATARPPADTLITGATGFIGGHLLERLAQDGASVRVTARSPATMPNVARYGVEVAATSVLDAAGVREAMRGVKTVFHLAVDGGAADARRVIVEGTRNVVEAAIEAHAECVVVLSTMYVYGFPETAAAVDETFPYRPYGGDYARNKAVMERWCLDRARSSGKTRIVVLNPTCVFGPAGGVYTLTPFELALSGHFGWIEGGAGLCNYNYAGNLVDAMLRAAEVPEAHGQRFLINDGAASWRDFLAPLLPAPADHYRSFTAAELTAQNRRDQRFDPRALVRAIVAAPDVRAAAKRSGAIRAASRLIGAGDWRPPAPPPAGAAPCAAPAPPPDWLASLYPNTRSRFSSAKAEQVLGWRPRVSLDEAQRITRAWLDENRPPA